MKLVDKFTLWYIGIILLVTPVSAYFTYRNIKQKIDETEIARLKDINNNAADRLGQGMTNTGSIISDHPVKISIVTSPLPEERVQVHEYKFYNKDSERNECRIDVTSFYRINNVNYQISSYNYVLKGDQILAGMLHTVILKMLVIISFIALSARLISGYILSPFKHTLRTIKNFSLQERKKIALPETSTSEFRQLNCFLKKMTDKAVEDYTRVKEFSENASHEVQTPLAVLRSKLELLSETEIRENQALLISDMQNAVDKLVRINRSLLLLTKLENQEYETSQNIRFCKITNTALSAFENWIQLKNLSVTRTIDKQVYLRMHPVLAEILLNNLFSNAIRHNTENGTIEVTLTPRMLLVKNTGLPPAIPTEELFRRFKKSNQCGDSIGLGLSIVKEICTVNGLGVSYNYTEGFHILQVDFPPHLVGGAEPEHEELFGIEGSPALS